MKRLQATLIVSRPHNGVLFTAPGWIDADGLWSQADGYYTLYETAPYGVNPDVYGEWCQGAINECANNIGIYSDIDSAAIPYGARAVIDDDGNVLFIVSMVAGDLDGNLPDGLEWERVA
jgi:hypothetical protein